MKHILRSFVFFLSRLWRKENLSQVSEKSSAVVISFRVVWCWVTQTICCSRVTVLTDVTSAFIPLIGGLVDDSQEGVEEGITRQKQEDKYQKSQHEYNSGECQEQMLEGSKENVCSFSSAIYKEKYITSMVLHITCITNRGPAGCFSPCSSI